MTSVRHDHIFHKDLMDHSFTYLGISLTFEDGNIMMSSGMNRHSSQFGTVSISCPAKLSIIMAQRKQADNLAYRNESQE
ncbi:hypothetical protein FGO68_gene11420 [Halteria grandinella]|uniref:Uncharacterized protein n=1 Tax=Halteria grandinella TaxID=5974 RepID=A0A8J8NTA7_HALGN|nr:hypothetical protein FGO68_gene11420 [Halteria grandinella]